MRSWLRRLRHALKWRLVLLFLLLAVATTAVFLFGMQRVLQGGWQAYAKPLVADYVDHLAAEIGSPPNAARAQAIVQRLPVSVRIEGPQVQYDSHPERTRRHRRWADTVTDTDSDDAQDFGATGWGLTRSTADGHRISFGLAAPPPGPRPRAVGWLTLGALLLLTGLAYAYVRRMLKPLDDIRVGALRFGGGDFTQPIPQRRADELGDLAAQINTMARGLQGMLDAKRALLLAISHELRSPLTRARVNAELVAEGPERDALLRDLGEMRDLIADLLESERLATGHAALHTEPTDLDALVQDTVQAQFPGRGVELQLGCGPAGGPALRPLDTARMRLLVRNLVGNALRHGAGGGRGPVVSTATEGTAVCLRVRDFGPGVSSEQLARLAEPFFRPDSARQRSTGGVGLGLFLCERVVAAHGGTLAFALAQPGLEVTARLP